MISASLIIITVLFTIPLRANKEWLADRLFKGPKSEKPGSGGEIDIIKGERMRSFSVADELLKWAKLKEDGHITEAEFVEARRKLLDRS